MISLSIHSTSLHMDIVRGGSVVLLDDTEYMVST